MSTLKSVSIRYGFVDFDVARSVTREEYEKTSSRSGVKRNDVLITLVSKYLGHANPAITMSIYAHELPEDMELIRTAMAKAKTG